jgi:hypothetical protein
MRHGGEGCGGKGREVKGVERARERARARERDVYYYGVARRPETTVKGEVKLREAKATTLGIVVHDDAARALMRCMCNAFFD